MPKLKPDAIIPDAAEDAATRAVQRAANAKPLAEAKRKATKPHARIGRPPKADAKVAVKLRLDPDLLAVLKATGPGWQTRINRILRERFAM